MLLLLLMYAVVWSQLVALRAESFVGDVPTLFLGRAMALHSLGRADAAIGDTDAAIGAHAHDHAQARSDPHGHKRLLSHSPTLSYRHSQTPRLATRNM